MNEFNCTYCIQYISGLLVICLGIFYIIKSIGQSDCIQQKKYSKTRYVHLDSPKAKLVEHEVQIDSSGAANETHETKYKSTESEGHVPLESTPTPNERKNPFDESDDNELDQSDKNKNEQMLAA